ncbi:MAG: hypothetical protein M9945_07750 [Aquamicrobium sp.]|jgi:hypothetical protein|uniref:hypothetical protein n=1 Tax=Paracoccus solventivorans TaxID=53463 RepID=UPI000935316A|nr:hypothetical protein [Paracoccus solventivorans]MCO5156637.1 hypothetical protein [Aquamicrobium sp.]
MALSAFRPSCCTFREFCELKRAGPEQVKGKERFEGFAQTFAIRLQQSSSFLSEIPDDIAASPTKENDSRCDL